MPTQSALGVGAPGAALTDALREALSRRLDAIGVAATFSSWDGQLLTLQQREASGGTEPDVLLIDQAMALAACREGLLRPLDRDAIGLGAPPAGERDCGLPAFTATLLLAWDKRRVSTPPEWTDFWDVARYPGKRGMPKQARGTLEIALLADGVKLGDVYGVLGSPGGPARAFRKLDQLRPYVVWWTDGSAALKALIKGGVLMTATPAFYQRDHAGPAVADIGQQWIGALDETLVWVVPARAANVSAAWQFLGAQRQADWQAAVSQVLPVVGASPDAALAMGDALLERTQAAPHRAESMLQVDERFWRDHIELEGRFEAWLAQSR